MSDDRQKHERNVANPALGNRHFGRVGRVAVALVTTVCLVATFGQAAPSPGPSAAAQTVTATPVQTDNFPPSIETVMGRGEQSDYFARVKAVKTLDRNLSDAEIQALYRLLNRKQGEDNLPPGQLNALKNEVAEALKAQTRCPSDLAQNLMAMFNDTGHDAVWRDYCIQHLGSWYAKLADETERRQVGDLLWKATGETGAGIAGTALIALADNAGRPGIERKDVAAKALALAGDPQCGAPVRITALQICAKFHENRVLPVARQIAASQAGIPLRVSALAAMGTLGEASDRPLLERWASSSDARLRAAARSALERLGPKG